jgi:hypothetical protein
MSAPKTDTQKKQELVTHLLYEIVKLGDPKTRVSDVGVVHTLHPDGLRSVELKFKYGPDL